MPSPSTIRPYYDPAYDAGTPAIVSYWAAFLGERSEMNKAEMKRRIAAMDPSGRRKEAQALRDNIAELERAKVQAVAKGQDSLDDFFRTLGNVIVADTNAAAGIEEKKLDIRGKAEAQRKDQEEARREEMTPKKQASYDALDRSFVDAQSARGTGQASGADQYMSGVREAIAQEGVDEGSSKAKHLAYLAIAQAGMRNDKVAVEALQGEFFPGEDPDAWIAEKRALVNPKGWDKRMSEVIGRAGAGGGARSFLEAIDALGLTPDKDQSGGGTVGVERGTTTRGARGAGLGQPIDTSSTDAIIDMYKKQLEALTNPSSSGNQFAGYRSNYLLETPFQTSAPALEETLRAMNEMNPTERSLVLGALQRKGGRAEPAAQYLRESFTGPQNGPLVAIADTGGDAYDWLQKSLDAALSKIESGNEALAERGRGDLQRIASEWGNLPPEMRTAFPQLEDAIVSGNTDSVRYVQRFFEKQALDGGGPEVGQWLADQATLVSQIRDPNQRAYEASKLYEIAQNVPREMGGDVAGTIVRVYEESRRAGDINLLDGGFKAIGTETQKTRDRQSLDFTREVSESAGPIRSSETDARLSVLSRQSREADDRLREMNPDTLEREMTREEDAEYRRNAAELERIIVDSGIERDYILNPNDPRAASRWVDVQRQRGDTAEAVATEAATQDPQEALRGSIDMPTGPGGVRTRPNPTAGAAGAAIASGVVTPLVSAAVGPIARGAVGRAVGVASGRVAPDPAPVEPQAKDDPDLVQIDMDEYLAQNGRPAGPALPSLPDPGAISALVAKQYVNPNPQLIAALRAEAERSRKELVLYGNRTDKASAGRRYAASISELYLSGGQIDDPAGASHAMAQYAQALDQESEAEQDEVERIKKAAKAELVRRAAKEVLGKFSDTGPSELPFAPRVEPTTDDWAP